MITCMVHIHMYTCLRMALAARTGSGAVLVMLVMVSLPHEDFLSPQWFSCANSLPSQ